MSSPNGPRIWVGGACIKKGVRGWQIRACGSVLRQKTITENRFLTHGLQRFLSTAYTCLDKNKDLLPTAYKS
ncbi:hypothetical protein BRARA_G00172 [Brassica rapa]|uniref:Uncharacterized protein n=1 Tax=Brassica campestris TaxID=3711 RepID=A0A397YGZ7_BRACM|nr:hypothetical protein BRARA_G00172 [Brassica rapa]